MPTPSLDEIRRQTAENERAIADSQRRIKVAEAKLAEKDIELAVEREAVAQGWQEPQKAWQLIDRDRIKQLSPDRIVGIPEALEAVARDYPGLAFGQGGGSGGTPTAAATSGKAASWSQEMAGMTPRQRIAALEPYRRDLESLGRGGRM